MQKTGSVRTEVCVINCNKASLYSVSADRVYVYAINSETGQLTPSEQGFVEATAGDGHPRNFMVDPLGEFLFVANRDGNHLKVFRANRETGALGMLEQDVTVPLPVCITYYKTTSFRTRLSF
jgi:6-phosphogluconolactonase (cycloisomerase 2 family)